LPKISNDVFDVANATGYGKLHQSGFKMKARLGCPLEFVFEAQQHVEIANQFLFREFLTVAGDHFLVFGTGEDFVFQFKLHHEQIAHSGNAFADVLLNTQTLFHDNADAFQKLSWILIRQCSRGPIDNLIWNESQDIPDIVLGDFLPAKGNNLVEKRLCVTHASFCRLDDIAQSAVINLRSLSIGDLP